MNFSRKTLVSPKAVAASDCEDRNPFDEFIVIANHPHPLAAAAGCRLDHDRIPDVEGSREGLVDITRLGSAAGNHAHPRGFGDPLGFDLVAHGGNGAGRRTDEDGARGLDRLDEAGVLGKKAETGVDRFGTRSHKGIDDPFDDKVALPRRRRSDGKGLIGHPDVECILVGL